MMIVPEKLSLLDYFAGQALAGILGYCPLWLDGHPEKTKEWMLKRCNYAYLYAETMLKMHKEYIMEEDE